MLSVWSPGHSKANKQKYQHASHTISILSLFLSTYQSEVLPPSFPVSFPPFHPISETSNMDICRTDVEMDPSCSVFFFFLEVWWVERQMQPASLTLANSIIVRFLERYNGKNVMELGSIVIKVVFRRRLWLFLYQCSMQTAICLLLK